MKKPTFAYHRDCPDGRIFDLALPDGSPNVELINQLNEDGWRDSPAKIEGAAPAAEPAPAPIPAPEPDKNTKGPEVEARALEDMTRAELFMYGELYAGFKVAKNASKDTIIAAIRACQTGA